MEQRGVRLTRILSLTRRMSLSRKQYWFLSLSQSWSRFLILNPFQSRFLSQNLTRCLFPKMIQFVRWFLSQ
jgi:hypothetical protein